MDLQIVPHLIAQPGGNCSALPSPSLAKWGCGRSGAVPALQPAPVAGVIWGAETPEGKEVSHVGALWTDNKDILVMLSDMDINAIAGTLKLYFRELPEPLLTDRLYPAFMEGIGKGSGMGKGLVPKCGCLALSALGWETLEGPSHLSPLGPGHSCHLYASSGLVALLPRVQDQSLMCWLPGGIWPRWAPLLHKMSPDPVLSPLPPCLQPSRILLPRRTA